MTPSNYRAGGAETDIRFAVGECSLGSILVAQSDRAICAIFLGDDPNSLVRELQDQFPKANLIGGDTGFERLVARVVGFVEEPALGLDLPLDVRGTAFQQRVWKALRNIPVGSTVSYTDVAKAHRLSKLRTRGRPSMRRRRAGGGDPLPSRSSQRWRIVGLPLGRRTKRALLESELES